MKRSEAKRKFIEFYEFTLQNNMRFTGEDFVSYAEQLGFYPPDSYYSEDEGVVAFWEMEDEDYEKIIREKKEFFDNLPRNLPISRINRYTGKPMQTRSHEMAFMWNNGSTIQEIADKFNVTRCRVETCLKKVERQMNKESSNETE